MKFEQGNIPYLNKKELPVDFSRKRFEFWLEKVPSDIRRWEYDLWQRYKVLSQIGLRTHEHLKAHGRAKPMPGYSLEDQDRDWESFKSSFLQGDERKNRLAELVDHVSQEWPQILEDNNIHISTDEIGVVALEGSGFYGPRKVGTKLSDIDIKILLRKKEGINNFEIMPSVKDEEKPPYHVIGCGETDESRFQRDDIHWFLYPHYPVFNSIPSQEINRIIDDLVKKTRDRKEEIEKKIVQLDAQIELRREQFILK